MEVQKEAQCTCQAERMVVVSSFTLSLALSVRPSCIAYPTVDCHEFTRHTHDASESKPFHM